MKRILGFLLPLILAESMAMATYLPGTVPSLTIGGYTFSKCELTNMIRLYSHTGTSGRVSTPRINWGTSGYQVPGGDSLRVITVQDLSDITTGACSLAYGDNDVGNNSASAQTNTVYLEGGNNGMKHAQSNPQSALGVLYINAPVPASKYLGLSASGNAQSCTTYAVLTSLCP